MVISIFLVDGFAFVVERTVGVHIEGGGGVEIRDGWERVWERRGCHGCMVV